MFIIATPGEGQDGELNSSDPTDVESSAPWNLKMKTLGGMQFWTDVHFAGGWRIQWNVVTEHFRLIDAKDVRNAWGSKGHCENELQKQMAAGNIVPTRGRVVILLHGLVRSHRCMEALREQLMAAGDFEVINFEYASTRNGIGEHAQALDSLISGLGDEVTEINFVAHSLGNLVVRHYLADQTDSTSGQQGDLRIARTVMLGPPNQGSKFARILKNSVLFGTIAGVSGAQLSTTWHEVEPKLATPRHEFGIISGGQEQETDFNNFILAGRDDFSVGLAETKLVGAKDWLVRPLIHSALLNNPEVMQATERFLKYGYFVSPEACHPILSLDENPEPVK